MDLGRVHRRKKSHMTNKPFKRCSALLELREMQIKILLRSNFPTSQNDYHEKKNRQTKHTHTRPCAGEDLGKWEVTFTLWKSV